MRKPRRIPILVLVLGAGSALPLLVSGAASESAGALVALSNGETIYACFTPAGTMYLIKQPGLSQECKGNHVEVSWNVEGPQGDQGDPGPQGETGLQGPQGPAGVSGYEKVQSPASPGAAVALCPIGKKVLGGGFVTTSGPIEAGVSIGINGQEGYSVTVADPNESIAAEAYCAIVGS